MRQPYVRPNVNASLIHEVRMIATQFFANRTQQKIWGNDAKPLMCAPCLQSRKKGKAAITVLDGTAVCADHVVTA